MSTISLTDYKTRIGQEVGISDWIQIDQKRIDTFATATLDDQFIHVDPARAAESPFGGTIAHGFLTLSMLSRMSYDALPQIENMAMIVNYGFNGLRFLAPVRSGARVRGSFLLKDISRKPPDRVIITHAVTVEIENEPKPALLAEWLTMAMF